MAGSFYNKSNSSDSIDISELASLNEDISNDMLSELELKLTNNVNSLSSNTVNDDSTLFEETVTPSDENTNVTNDVSEVTSAETEEETTAEKHDDSQTAAVPQDAEGAGVEEKADSDDSESEKKDALNVNQNFDDNFIKKYKAKLNKKAQNALNSGKSVDGSTTKKYMQEQAQSDESIENLSNGNITELPLTQEIKEYNESLDFLDGNVKYSKYVIYIDPKNVDFIDGLTVKERKNLINDILRQQDDISITKQRFAFIQTVIRQVIIAVLTISISIPVVYYVINASLEATIDNYRRSESNWQVLYRQHGKITQGARYK